jgi:hypothetical protein
MHATYRKPLTLDRFNRALFPVHNCGTYELDAGKAFTVYDEDSESLVSTIFTATSSDSSTILQPAGEDISYHEICFGMVGADIWPVAEPAFSQLYRFAMSGHNFWAIHEYLTRRNA